MHLIKDENGNLVQHGHGHTHEHTHEDGMTADPVRAVIVRKKRLRC